MEEIGYMMLQMLILFCSAQILGKIVKRIGMPEIVGYILAGAIFVNLCIYTDLGKWLEFHVNIVLRDHSNFINVMGQLGLVFMLFGVGLETRLGELLNIGKKAMVTAILGIIFPFIGGIAVYYLFGSDYRCAIMVGTAIFAMSTVVSVNLLQSFGVIDSRVGKLVVGIAIISDILCLILMAVNSALVNPVDDSMVILDIAMILAFVVFVLLFIWHAERRKHHRERIMEKLSLEFSHMDLFIIAIIICLAFTASSYIVGLSGIVGAFLAGMYFAEFEKTSHIIEKFETLVKFLLPFFFIFVGLRLRLDEMSVNALIIGIVLAVVAVIAKFAGGYVGAKSCGVTKETSKFVASCMIPRGDIAIVVASLALSMGLFGTDLYAGVIIMAVITQVCALPIMRRTFEDVRTKDPDMLVVDEKSDLDAPAVGLDEAEGLV